MSITRIRTALKDRTVRAIELMAYADPSGMVYLDDFYAPQPPTTATTVTTVTTEPAASPRTAELAGHNRRAGVRRQLPNAA